jgi:hypothetical protein
MLRFQNQMQQMADTLSQLKHVLEDDIVYELQNNIDFTLPCSDMEADDFLPDFLTKAVLINQQTDETYRDYLNRLHIYRKQLQIPRMLASRIIFDICNNEDYLVILKNIRKTHKKYNTHSNLPKHSTCCD